MAVTIKEIASECGVSEQQTAQAAQALHAGTIQQQLAGEIEVDQQRPEAEQKRSWFKKLFRG